MFALSIRLQGVALALALVTSAALLFGCGYEPAVGLAGNTAVGFVYDMPVSTCDVEHDVYATGSTPPLGDRVSTGFDVPCLDMVPDEQGLIPYAVMDLPPSEWTVEVSVELSFLKTLSAREM